MKTEENVSKTWVDHRLTNACKYGFTVIYDEFNRSRPEANNVLLGVLEERLLELPAGRVSESYIQVHPAFKAIFYQQPGGIRRCAQNAGCTSRSHDHNHHLSI